MKAYDRYDRMKHSEPVGRKCPDQFAARWSECLFRIQQGGGPHGYANPTEVVVAMLQRVATPMAGRDQFVTTQPKP
jgi:hypothetical protein